MPSAFLILIACQLVGEALRVVLSLPIPGPVIGMFLLAVLLAVADRNGSHAMAEGTTRRSLERTAEALISHMGLLFVPAGVGIIAEASILRQEWLPIVAAVVGSTLLSIAVTGLVMHWLMRHAERRRTGIEPKQA
ncbi:MAG TPA: CidA/LrgA family protein [Rhizobium sp.]